MRPGWGLPLFLTLSTLLIIGAVNAEEKKAATQKVVPEITASRINPHAPTIDGNLDDEIWMSHLFDTAKNFLQMEPNEGESATESTLVAVAYDDDAIYFAFWNYDSEPDKIKQQLVRRDRWAESDMITVRLDPYHDHQTGYRFELNASGVQRDFRLFDDTNMDQEWDGVWEGSARIQPWGWSAEVRIPYHCLRFATKDEHTWGCNVTRYISRKNESDWWAFSPSSEGGSVSQFGHVNGIKGIAPARHLEVLPYVVSRYENEPRNLANPDGHDQSGNVGFDLKYGLSSNLTLDATVNPDFGQVELDEPVLNLSAFETWFPEKRPFFLEGAGMYSTPFMLFYSRRIGRPPFNAVDEGMDYFYTQYPKATTISGAAKLTGKLTNGTTIGFLSALTDEEKADYTTFRVDYNVDPLTGDTLSTDTVLMDAKQGVVETRANYNVLRLQQDIFSNSNVGVLFTNVNQDHLLPVTTGGMDWRLSNANSTLTFRGQTVFSRISNSKTGFGMTGSIEKMFGRHVQGSIGGTVKDPHLYINRLGYTSRNDSRRGYMWMQYRTMDDWFVFRNTYNNINFYAGWNYRHVNIEKGWNFNTYIEFTNYWNLGAGYSENYDEYDDLETRGMGDWKKPVDRGWWASMETDRRKIISLNLNPGSGVARNGTWWAHYTGLNFRPRSNMEYSIGANVYRGFGQTRWVTNDENYEHPIFADLDQDRLTFHLGASIMFRRNLSFQLSGQGYITSLNYENYRPYLDGNDYGDPVDIGDLDRNFSALNSTMIIRWEYLPGSTVYLVWSRERNETDRSVNDLDIDRDLKRLFSFGSSNVWLVKASYWWNI